MIRPWIFQVTCAAIAITLLYCVYHSKSRVDEKTASAAEDEVYEAVVRAMVTPTHGQANTRQLVFDETALVGFMSGVDAEACKASVRKRLPLNETPPFNSLADKVYRVLTSGWYDGSPRADTIGDFVERSCAKGPLSRTFHTNAPRVFIDPDSVFFDIAPVDRNGVKAFQQTFPGASGIISLSHAGFDSSLHEAIVSTSFVCGGLCGTGRLYILRKIGGRWKVIGNSITWVS